MVAAQEHADLLEMMGWIDSATAGLTLPADERSMLGIGCLDITIEHQAAVALLHQSELHGSMLALLRPLGESLVRGLWLLLCATHSELSQFKRGKVPHFGAQIASLEHSFSTPNGVLSQFKTRAWLHLNDFTHTGFQQVSRRHSPGKVGGNYPAHELAQALDIAGVFGMVAAGQIIALADRPGLLEAHRQKVVEYGSKRPPPK